MKISNLAPLKFEKEPLNSEGIKRLLESKPTAGGGLNNWLFVAAIRLVKAYDTNEEALPIFEEMTKGDPIRKGELLRTLRNARGRQNDSVIRTSSGEFVTWPSVNEEQRKAITDAGLGLAGFGNVSDDLTTEDVIDLLFPGNPLLCCGAENFNFATAAREEWRGELADLSLIVPSAMSAKTGVTKEGKESMHSISNTGPRQYLVIEQDYGTVDEQASILLHLKAQGYPLIMAVHSGGKSVHGWFRCVGVEEERLRVFMQKAVALGADRATWTKSQFVRMPGGKRQTGEIQRLLYFDKSLVR